MLIAHNEHHPIHLCDKGLVQTITACIRYSQTLTRDAHVSNALMYQVSDVARHDVKYILR